MKIELVNNDYRFDCENMCMLFFPNSKFSSKIDDGRFVRVSLNEDFAFAEFIDNNGSIYKATAEIFPFLYDKEKAALKTALFKVFSKATGINPPWGIVTGIRPVSFWLKMCEIHGDKASEVMERYYLVHPGKIELCREAAVRRALNSKMCADDTVSVYISIPFCPSRCKYCSFVSGVTEREHGYIPEYLNILKKELLEKAEIIKQNGQKILTVYIGGGTPTILSSGQLDELLFFINSSFDVSNVCEFTVESGRPDTISIDKVEAMKRNGVTRISVNPQTLNDNVLKLVGRNHTVADFYQAYNIASGKDISVNVDLIAGLPGETADEFAKGVDIVTKLFPDNITIHSLYIKRAADYGKSFLGVRQVCAGAEVGTLMLDYGYEILRNNGYLPYYIYRQKNTVGNNENTGYAKPDKECRYNIFMMEDLQTVYGCGAGSVTKIVDGIRIERVSNTKFAYNYVKDLK